MRKTTCRITGSANSDPLWKLRIGYMMMLLTNTCGYRSLPSHARKPKYWKPYNTTWQIHAWSSGECYGSRHPQVSIVDFWTMVWSSRNTTKLSIWPFSPHSQSPFWTMHTPRSCFLRWIRTVLTNMPERVWYLEKRYDGLGTGWEAWSAVWKWWQSQRPGFWSQEEWDLGEFAKWMMPSISRQGMRVPIYPSSSPSLLKSRSRVKKNLAVLKKAMTRTNTCWSSRGWHTKTSWQRSPVDDGRSKFSGHVEEASTPGEMERSLSHCGRTRDAGKRQGRDLC